jgi:hypothetical protein
MAALALRRSPLQRSFGEKVGERDTFCSPSDSF